MSCYSRRHVKKQPLLWNMYWWCEGKDRSPQEVSPTVVWKHGISDSLGNQEDTQRAARFPRWDVSNHTPWMPGSSSSSAVRLALWGPITVMGQCPHPLVSLVQRSPPHPCCNQLLTCEAHGGRVLGCNVCLSFWHLFLTPEKHMEHLCRAKSVRSFWHITKPVRSGKSWTYGVLCSCLKSTVTVTYRGVTIWNCFIRNYTFNNCLHMITKQPMN